MANNKPIRFGPVALSVTTTTNIHADTAAGKLARLAYTAGGTHGGGKSSSAHPGDKRTLGQKLYQAG